MAPTGTESSALPPWIKLTQGTGLFSALTLSPLPLDFIRNACLEKKIGFLRGS